MRPGSLTVHPGPPLHGRFEPPGDKSITHRAWILALLADGESKLAHLNPGADCGATRDAAHALGLTWSGDGSEGRATGCGGVLREPERILDCGNSGTSMRLLAGVVAARPIFTVLAGDASLHRRPMNRILEPLRRMGADARGRDGDRLPPLAIRGADLDPIDLALPVASAQVASCLLLAGLNVRGRVAVTLPGPARDHTERMLAAAGVPLEIEPETGGGRRVVLHGPARPRPLALRVPGDFSAAAFFLAAAAATPGARVTAVGVGLNPTRTGLLDALEAMGARIVREHERMEGGEEVGDVTVEGAALRGVEVPAAWLPRMIDEVPAWAVAAALARGRSRLVGAAELRVKESDRIAALVAGLGSLSVEAVELPDGLEIEGGEVHGGAVASAGDHRIAMAFATLGTRARGPVHVADAGPIATSYPGFADTLAALGGGVAAGAEAPA